jgi:hypothetical protein
MSGLSGADVGMLGAAGAVVLFAILYALLRGDRRDPLERLARWAASRGLHYVAPVSGELLATFVGQVEGRAVEIRVERAARGFGVDLPATLTTVTVGSPGGAAVCVLQPAAWVMDRDGREASETVPSGDADFDAKWSARGPDAIAVARCLLPGVRARLLDADADGLIVELFPAAVAIPMPGLVADARELERRLGLALALDLARMA